MKKCNQMKMWAVLLLVTAMTLLTACNKKEEIEETKKDRNCVVFQVEKWLELERSIKPSSNIKVIAITSFDKIKKAKSYDDLY
mgnify:CR=1 FL=1